MHILFAGHTKTKECIGVVAAIGVGCAGSSDRPRNAWRQQQV